MVTKYYGKDKKARTLKEHKKYTKSKTSTKEDKTAKVSRQYSKKKVHTLPTQHLEEKKKQSIGSKALDIVSAPLSQPKTTLTKGIRAGAKEVKQRREDIERGEKGGMGVIGTTLGTTAVAGGTILGAGALAGGGGLGAGAVKVSSATMATIRTRLALTKLTGVATRVGGKGLSKIGRTGGRYASNSKTSSLTKKMLIGAGISLGVASIAKDILGTYPFASFGKEETLQSISFVMTQAINNGLYEEAQGILNTSNEIVNATPTLIDKIPYANVQKEFKRYAEQQKKNNLIWQEVIDKKIAEVGQESDFARERREGDEAAFERKRVSDEEESKRYEDIETKRKEEDLEDMRWKSEYYKLIREGRHEEAEELLQSR